MPDGMLLTDRQISKIKSVAELASAPNAKLFYNYKKQCLAYGDAGDEVPMWKESHSFIPILINQLVMIIYALHDSLLVAKRLSTSREFNCAVTPIINTIEGFGLLTQPNTDFVKKLTKLLETMAKIGEDKVEIGDLLLYMRFMRKAIDQVSPKLTCSSKFKDVLAAFSKQLQLICSKAAANSREKDKNVGLTKFNQGAGQQVSCDYPFKFQQVLEMSAKDKLCEHQLIVEQEVNAWEQKQDQASTGLDKYHLAPLKDVQIILDLLVVQDEITGDHLEEVLNVVEQVTNTLMGEPEPETGPDALSVRERVSEQIIELYADINSDDGRSLQF